MLYRHFENRYAQLRNLDLLLPLLPDHLSRMSLFVLNSGVRDDVVCNLRWQWEIKVPELGISVFEVPMQHVKGKRRSRVVVCNSVAQSVIESVRGQHEDFVFVYRRERTKNLSEPPLMLFIVSIARNDISGGSLRFFVRSRMYTNTKSSC